MVRAMPNRSCRRGAPNTAKMATSTPQPKKTSPSLIGAEVHGERRVAEDGEEAPVVAERGQRHGEQAAVPQRAQRRRQAGFVVGPRGALDQHDGGDQRDGHQGRHPVERAAPADVAEGAAQQRADGDADAQRGFVQDDGAGEPAAGRRDDDGQGGGDEQRVADAPAGPEADDPVDGGGGAGRRAEDHDKGQAGDQGRLGAQPAGHPVGDEHGHRGDDQVAGEQQRHLARRGVQLMGDRGQDRVDQADAHERHDASERDGEDGFWLPERARRRARGPASHNCSIR